MTPLVLFSGIVFSSIGIGFFIYGKKQQRAVFLFCGLALIIFPYVVPNLVAMIVIGIVLSLIPWFIRI